MSTISKERVKDILEFGAGRIISPITDDEIIELARIALASLEAEAVAYVDPFAFHNFSVYRAGETDNKRMGREWMWANPDAGLIPVYTSPPEPVTINAEPVAWLWSHRKHPSEVTLVRHEDDERAEGAHWSGWSCQALYAAPPEPVSVPDDIDTRMKNAGMLSAAEIIAGQPIDAFMKHAGVVDLESLLKWAEMRRAEFLRMQAKYELGDNQKDDMYEWVTSHVAAFSELHVNIRAAMLQGADGNSPVIPDGLRLALSNAGIAAPESDEMLAATCEKYIQALVTWVKERKPFRSAVLPDSWVSCSERMPEENAEQEVLACFKGGDISTLYYFEGRWDDAYGIVPIRQDVTHWMPLPAAPQQEVN